MKKCAMPLSEPLDDYRPGREMGSKKLMECGAEGVSSHNILRSFEIETNHQEIRPTDS